MGELKRPDSLAYLRGLFAAGEGEGREGKEGRERKGKGEEREERGRERGGRKGKGGNRGTSATSNFFWPCYVWQLNTSRSRRG